MLGLTVPVWYALELLLVVLLIIYLVFKRMEQDDNN